MGSLTSLSLADALYRLRQLIDDASFLNSLQPPERLCLRRLGNPPGEYKEKLDRYRVKQIDENDPIFDEVHKVIQLIQDRLASSSSSAGEYLNRIKSYYQNYIRLVCQAADSERIRFLKGKALCQESDAFLLKDAIEQKDDPRIYALINRSEKPFIPKTSTEWFNEAESSNNFVMQVLILEKEADFYLNRKLVEKVVRGKNEFVYPNDLVKASECLNAALAIAQNEKILPLYRDHLLKKLENLEKEAFLVFLGKEIQLDHYWNVGSRREELKAIRDAIVALVENGDSIHRIITCSNDKLRDFLAKLIEMSIRLAGHPPTTYAFISLGSMARREMCVYSDVEFAIVVKKDTPEIRGYFRRVMYFLDICIRNMGETEYKLGRLFKSPTPHGFSLDIGGNVPFLNGIWDMFGTPESLAQYQNLNSLKENDIGSNALTYVGLITGSESLLSLYRSSVARQLNAYVDGSWLSFEDKERVHERRALILFKSHLKTFQLKLSEEKEKERLFKIKDEFYRIMQSACDTLALFYNLESQNTQARIKEMIQKRILSQEGGKQLLRAMEMIMMFRLRAQLFYRDGHNDYLYHPRLCRLQTDEEVKDYIEVKDEYVAVLEEIYKTLYPFYHSIKRFFELNANQSANSKEAVKMHRKNHSLKYETFYTDLTDLARNYYKTLQWSLAEKISQQAVALNPNNTEALRLLIQIKIGLRKHRDAAAYIQESFALFEQSEQNDAQKIEIAACMMLMGRSFQLVHNYKRALHWHQKALAALRKISNKICVIYLLQSDEDEETKSSAESIRKKNIIFNYQLSRMDALQLIGQCYKSLHQWDSARDCYQEALELVDNYWLCAAPILQKKLGDIRLFLGDLSLKQGKLEPALKYYHEALEDYTSVSEKLKSNAKFGFSQMETKRAWLIAKSGDFELEGPLNARHKAMLVEASLFDQIYTNPNALNRIVTFDRDFKKNHYVSNQIKDVELCKIIAHFHIAKLQSNSADPKIQLEGIQLLEKILDYSMNGQFADRTQEEVIECLLALAESHLHRNHLPLAFFYTKVAFKLASEYNLFSLILECSMTFISMYSTKKLIKNFDPEILHWAKKVYFVLDTAEEECADDQLLKIREFQRHYKKLLSEVQNPYLSWIGSLMLVNKIEKANQALLQESLQRISGPNRIAHEGALHQTIEQELFSWINKTVESLEKMGDEQGFHLLLPILLQLHKHSKKFPLDEENRYLNRMINLIASYGIEEVDPFLLEEFYQQLLESHSIEDPIKFIRERIEFVAKKENKEKENVSSKYKKF